MATVRIVRSGSDLRCQSESAERGGLTKTFLFVFGTRQLGIGHRPRLGYETREYFIIEYGFILINIFLIVKKNIFSSFKCEFEC